MTRLPRHPGCVLFALALLQASSNVLAFHGEVIISGGGDKNLLRQLEARLSLVINELETGDLSGLAAEFTPHGLAASQRLLAEVPMENSRPVHETHLITLRDGTCEVRGIRVRVSQMGETGGTPFQYLVFSLDGNGRIDDIRFSVEADHYERVIDEHVDLTDLARRQLILQFVEIFRTAHNRKDIAYLERVYSDHALIIVGRVLEPQTGTGDGLSSALRRDSEIQFIRRSKTEYIEALKHVFARNDFVKVMFEKVEVVRHHRDHDLYGVTLKQVWTSSTYSDEGWLFKLVDFRDSEHPLIHVRSWQPRPFEDGSVMGLYDFELID